MPLPEICTLYIRVWVGQRCGACGADFQYLRRFKLLRRETYYDDTAAKVEADYAKHCRDTAESCPCPHCGWLQPDMIGTSKAVNHGTGTFAGFLILLINLIATALVLMPRTQGCLLAAGIAGGLLLFHLYQALGNPNRLLILNLDIAKMRLEDGSLRLIKPGGAPVFPVLPLPLVSILLAASLLPVAAFLFAAPALFDWPLGIGMVLGLILVIASGATLANLGLRLKELATPREVVEVNSTVVTDESVPEDFQKR